MKALIQENRVCQIEESEFPVAPSLTWVDCSNDVEAGWTFNGSSFSEPPAATVDDVRGLRNAMLATSDWTQMTDTALSDSKNAEWAIYRQSLRDLPASYPDITWPVAPSKED